MLHILREKILVECILSSASLGKGERGFENVTFMSLGVSNINYTYRVHLWVHQGREDGV
jgi:hypothetical protein